MDTAESLYDQASIFHREKNFDKARELYETIVVRFPLTQEADFSKSKLSRLPNAIQKSVIFEEYRKQGEIQALKTKVSRALKDARTQFIAEYQFVWEYRVLIDASVRQLDAEGADGWELVSVSSYQTGGGFTLNGLGGERYTVHQQYTFKRRVISATNDAIRSLEAQLAAFDEPSVK